jgi:hypothetical protein
MGIGMDWQFKVGIGVAIVFGLLPFAVKDMPHWITWPGITIGALLAVWGVIPNHEKIPLGPAFLFIICSAGIAGSVAWYVDMSASSELPQLAETFELSVGRSIEMGRDNTNRPALRAMYLSAWNGTKIAVQIESAKAVSGETGETQELRIPVMENNHWINILTSDANPIPPKTRVVLRIDFTENGSDGLTEDEALRRWATGYFEVRYLGKTVNVGFDETNLVRAFNDAKPKPEPHVTKKQ